MVYDFHTQNFDFRYMEDTILKEMLIENHCHSKFEMLAVIKGDISVIIEGKTFKLTSGDAIIVPPLLYHTVSSNKSGGYHRFTVIFDTNAIPAPLKQSFLEKNAINTAFSWHRFDELVKISKAGNDSFYSPLFESFMTELFYSYHEEKSELKRMGSKDILENAISYIDEHLFEKILLEDIAKHVACSKSLVSHLFQEKMNISVKQYVIKKKLAMFDILLRSGMSPTDATAKLGYEHYSDFYRIRKKHEA